MIGKVGKWEGGKMRDLESEMERKWENGKVGKWESEKVIK